MNSIDTKTHEGMWETISLKNAGTHWQTELVTDTTMVSAPPIIFTIKGGIIEGGNTIVDYGYEKRRGVPYADASDKADVILLDNHPHDSRVTIREDGVCQTISGWCGTGGGIRQW